MFHIQSLCDLIQVPSINYFHNKLLVMIKIQDKDF